MANAPLPRKGSSLSLALLGLYAGLAFAIATVYMGENVVPIFFMVTGFTEGYLRAGGDKLLVTREPQEATLEPALTRFVY